MKQGLLLALLASMSASSLEEIDPSKIGVDQLRLVQNYVSPELRDFIGDAIMDAKQNGRAVVELLPKYQIKINEKELAALSLIYSGYTEQIIEITSDQISVINPQLVA